MRAVASYGSGSAEDGLATYKRYFPPSDEEDDFQTHVKDVLAKIAGTDAPNEMIGPIVKDFVVDNLGELHHVLAIRSCDFH